MSKQKIVASMLIALGTIGFGFWRWNVSRQSRPAHYVVVWDRSESTATDCDCVVASAKQALETSHVRKGSTLTVIATGDPASAGEPIVIASYVAPISRRVLDGRGAAADRREQLLTDLKSKCEKVGRTKTSSIFLAVKRGIEHLRAAGCDGSSHCVLQVETDLEENINLQIKTALDGRAGAEHSLPAPINNEDIDIAISGIAEKAGAVTAVTGSKRRVNNNRDQGRADRVVEVWRKLFTKPNHVTFQPYCSMD